MREVGAVELISKPFDVDDLLDAIERLQGTMGRDGRPVSRRDRL
jgi:hypothetical protein